MDRDPDHQNFWDIADDFIASGEGRSFAPAGKVFREWVAIPSFVPSAWEAYIEESIAFVSSLKKK